MPEATEIASPTPGTSTGLGLTPDLFPNPDLSPQQSTWPLKRTAQTLIGPRLNSLTPFRPLIGSGSSDRSSSRRKKNRVVVVSPAHDPPVQPNRASNFVSRFNRADSAETLHLHGDLAVPGGSCPELTRPVIAPADGHPGRKNSATVEQPNRDRPGLQSRLACASAYPREPSSPIRTSVAQIKLTNDLSVRDSIFASPLPHPSWIQGHDRMAREESAAPLDLFDHQFGVEGRDQDLRGSAPASISSTARSGGISPSRRSISTSTSSLTSASRARLSAGCRKP